MPIKGTIATAEMTIVLAVGSEASRRKKLRVLMRSTSLLGSVAKILAKKQLRVMVLAQSGKHITKAHG